MVSVRWSALTGRTLRGRQEGPSRSGCLCFRQSDKCDDDVDDDDGDGYDNDDASQKDLSRSGRLCLHQSEKYLHCDAPQIK